MERQQEITMMCDVSRYKDPSPLWKVPTLKFSTFSIIPARLIFEHPVAAQAHNKLWSTWFKSAWKRNCIIRNASVAVIAVQESIRSREQEEILDAIPESYYIGFAFAVPDYKITDRIWIEEVMVHPACHLQGVGKSLMSCLLQALKREGILQAALTCNPNRRVGKRTLPEFYKQFGFRQQQ